MFCKIPVTLSTGGFCHSEYGTFHEHCWDRYERFGTIEAERKYYDIMDKAQTEYAQWRKERYN